MRVGACPSVSLLVIRIDLRCVTLGRGTPKNGRLVYFLATDTEPGFDWFIIIMIYVASHTEDVP